MHSHANESAEKEYRVHLSASLPGGGCVGEKPGVI